MGHIPTLVFIPGAWHKPICYDKVIEQLSDNGIRCETVTLPSTDDNPNATFKDDIDSARNVILQETRNGRDVIVVAHSFGGMVGNSAVKDLTPNAKRGPTDGCVRAIVLIASGFTLTGLAFMDLFFGIPPPQWRINKETGYADIVMDPIEFFYHDVPRHEAQARVEQLTTQGLKTMFEGGEHAYAGWKDVPNWYIGTVEDRGMPVLAQRMLVSMARGQGAVVHHVELVSSHSPFLSMPTETVEILLDAVNTVTSAEGEKGNLTLRAQTGPGMRFLAPVTWAKFGIPFLLGRAVSSGLSAFMWLRSMWRGS